MANGKKTAQAVNGEASAQPATPPPPPPGDANMLAAALWYADMGWSVVPLCHPTHAGRHPPNHPKACQRPGKQPVRKLKPLFSKAFTHADLHRIWEGNPRFNVGVVTGLVSKLFVVDCDSEEALAAFEDLVGRKGTETWAFQSGRKLPHFLYTWQHDWAPDGSKLRKLHPKLDGLGEGAQTVMPPSLHENGERYEWVRGGPGSRMGLSPCPVALGALLQPKQKQDRPRGGGGADRSDPEPGRSIKRARAYAATCEPAIQGSGGRVQTFKVCCKMVQGFGLSPLEARDVLLEDWNKRCVPPWTPEDLLVEVMGALTRGQGGPIEHKTPEVIPAPPPATNGQARHEPAAPPPPPMPGRLASSLTAKDVAFVYEPYVARSMLTLLVGVPNTGKSTFLAHLISRARASIVLPGFEEDPDVMLRPRLVAAGCALDRVRVLDSGDWTMPAAKERLKRVILHDQAELVVADPVSSYLSMTASENDSQAVRALLESFAHIAVETGAAVVAVRHPGKSASNVMRGSGAWREVPRVIVELMIDPTPPPRRLIQFYKDGLGRNLPPRLYALAGPKGGAKVFTLADAIGEDAAELAREMPDSIERNKHEQAVELLLSLLGKGEMESKLVFSAAEIERLSERTLRRAGQTLGVKVRREGQGMEHRSYWSFPPAGG